MSTTTTTPPSPSTLLPIPKTMIEKITDEASQKNNGNDSTVSSEAPAGSGEITAAFATNTIVSSQFTCFKKLPLELRRQIWKEACCVSRFVDIWATPIGEDLGDYSNYEFYGQTLYSTKSTDTPAILHRSPEARSVGLEHYSLAFGSSTTQYFGKATIQITIPSGIYFQWGWDIACPMGILTADQFFDDEDWFEFFIRKNSKKKKIHTIALDIDDQFLTSWERIFGWSRDSGCREILLYHGRDSLLHSLIRARTWKSINVPLNKVTNEELEVAALN
jgi:2EXR family